MRTRSRLNWLVALTGLCALTTSRVSAQVAVTDPAVTIRNSITAATMEQLVQTQLAQYQQLQRMARRLSSLVRLDRYLVSDIPLWRIHDFENPDVFLFARDYLAALNYGDSSGSAYARIARRREPAEDALARLTPASASTLRQMLATIDLADSAMTTATHQTGTLRYNGRAEGRAINALETHVVDPSNEQSTAAVADKISGAVLIAARQRQARIQLLSATLEQLLIENKRTRDTDASLMTMRLMGMREGRRISGALAAGAGSDLRSWRQP